MKDLPPLPQTPAEIRGVLEICRDIELVASSTYLALAEAHAFDAPLVALWRKTGAEEINHAEQIALALRLRKGLLAGSTLDRRYAELMLAKVRSFLREIHAHPPSPQQALEKSIAFEEELAQFHLEQAATFIDKSQVGLFRAMQAADKGHVECLKRALSDLKGRACRP